MTEGFGAASIFSDEWLRKPGSVGRPLMGVPHVVGLDGAELPPGEADTIWFEWARSAAARCGNDSTPRPAHITHVGEPTWEQPRFGDVAITSSICSVTSLR
jgi:long-chain acyl-CoA synthetase